MSERFDRFGRSCPKNCKETCCIICEHSTGAIEFIPTKPVICCKFDRPERLKEGRNCPVFEKHVFNEYTDELGGMGKVLEMGVENLKE